MKKLILLLVLFFLADNLISQSTFEPVSQITSAVIYERGAMVTRTIDPKNINSNGIVKIDSLPQNINFKTIQAKCGTGLKIVSIKKTEALNRIEVTEEKDRLNLIIELIKDSIDYQNTLLKSIEKEIEVIHKNDNFKTESGTNMEQLAKASELYKTNLRSLNLEQLEITKKRDKLNLSKYKIQSELSQIQPKIYKNLGVEIKIEYVSNLDKTLTLSYFSPDASWYTFYDLRISGSDINNSLDHKAYVSQSTGEDWTDVKLTLSNRNPNKRISHPSINPYILQNIKHHAYRQNTSGPDDGTLIRGKVTDVHGETLIGASVFYKSLSIGTITDIDGFFTLPKSNICELIISYTGYQTQQINACGLSFMEIVLSEGQLLNEIVVVGYSGEKDEEEYEYKSKKIEARKSITVKTQQSLNVHSFEISSPYTIPSSGEEYDVLLNTNTISFVYQYVAFPSLEPTAYLSVGIPEWRTYDFFSGNVNLFLEGQYTGVSNIDIQENSDTLWFSLGEDIGVHIEKEIVKEFNKKSFFKNKTIELHTFDIAVKNNKNRLIDIDIMDQVPISTDDDVEVKILEISKADYDEKKGFLSWKESLLPGENKIYRVSYEIKYGNDVDIVGNK